ncbi:MAG: hypothetical protein HQ582_31765 [Planctomycetes bacterium]|nr:hypothetical protein [Planctomycetota bacterium]
MIHKLIHIAGPIFVFVAGCGDTTPPARSDSSARPATTPPASQTSIPTPRSEQPTATSIPKDVTYTIIEKNIVPGIKRSLDIRLNRKVSQDVLSSIAMELKNSDPNSYERTFIGYYLPDMKVGAGCWATTHFNPNLEVRVLGLTAEQERAFTQQRADPSREIIGSWLDESIGGANVTTIFRKDGRLFMENTYSDGSAGTDELVETPSPDGRRFDSKPDRGFGEYYLINSKGELQLLDQDGPFMTAKKVN